MYKDNKNKKSFGSETSSKMKIEKLNNNKKHFIK